MTARKESIDILPFRNPELPLEERIDDLISRLTLAEKISLIPTRQPAIERLGIKACSVGREAARGWVSREDDPATVFPQPIGLSCTWNKELMNKIGTVIGDEARIYHRKKDTGLFLWAPTVDMVRDPRWGRTEEAYGEDPCLTGKMASELVKGMQGTDPFYLKTAATLKHFYANNNEEGRCYTSVSIDPRNMREYYWQAFRPVIEDGKASCIMTAYNEINEVPAILNKDVKNVVKGEWGLPGFVVGDGSDFSQTVTMHHYYDNHAESIADILKSGVDCIPDDTELIKEALKEALERELLTEEDLDQALRNIFRIRFRLGEFDPEDLNPYSSIDESVLCCEEHSKLALEAARESIVLLKNDNNMLPLRKGSIEKVAVIGPLGDIIYRDWYTGVLPYEVTPLQGIKNKLPDKEIIYKDGSDWITLKALANDRYIRPAGEGKTLIADGEEADEDYLYKFTDWGWGSNTLLSRATGKYVTTSGEGLTASADEVYGWFVRELYDFQIERDGSYRIKTWDKRPVSCNIEGKSELSISDKDSLDNSGKFAVNTVKNGIDEAVKAAREADVAIVFLGNHPLINGREEIDRQDIILPPAQEKLLKAVYKANPNTVLVLISSYPVAINWADENIPAILYLAHGGQETGNAIADVLFGDFSPAGRLSMTWYRSIEQLPDIMDYDIIKGKRTYMYFDGDPLYPFGYGLSYTRFKYSNLKINKKRFNPEDKLVISLQVKNIGHVVSNEVVQLYISALNSRVKRPLKELKDFKKIKLAPGEVKELNFTISLAELAFWDVTRDKYCLEKGFYKVMLGSSSADIRLSEIIEINGEVIPPRDPGILTEAWNYDDYQGIALGEVKKREYKEGGTCVKFMAEDSWIAFHDVDFNEGFNKLEVLATSNLAEGIIELRLDSPEGYCFGKCKVLPKKKGEWQTSTCNIENISGRHDLYIKSNNNLKMRHFRFLP